MFPFPLRKLGLKECEQGGGEKLKFVAENIGNHKGVQLLTSAVNAGG